MSTSSILICLSGKRKSGKDFVAQKFSQFLNEHGLPVSLCSISNPLKAEFADLNDLDLERLKSDSNYKESVRKEMVAYGSQVRVEDPAYFCRKALAQRSSTSSHTDYSGPEIIIVTDCRRPSDLNFFRNEFGNAAVFIRIDASLEIRNKRGFTFVEGIDDAETECALDNFTEWQFNVYNNGMNDDIPEFLNIYDFIRSKI